jgi:hypothetical protein
LNEKSKFHQQLHHKHELEHLYNIYVEIKHYNSLSPITLEWKIEISPKSIQTIRLSIPITMQSLRWIGQGVLIYSATYEKLPTIWWIKSHNSGMKNWNFTKKYTDHKTINSNNYAKFEVNWPRGSHLQRDIRKITYNLMNKVP